MYVNPIKSESYASVIRRFTMIESKINKKFALFMTGNLMNSDAVCMVSKKAQKSCLAY